MDYEGLDAGYEGEDVAAGLLRYMSAPGPIYPKDDPRLRALHRFLYGTKPDPRTLAGIFAPHEATEVTDRLLRRDAVAYAVVTSFIRRVHEPDDPHPGPLWDMIVNASANFAFDPVYGDSDTATGAEIAELMTDDKVLPDAHSCAAVVKHLPALIERWRGRAATFASSTFFGIALRYAGDPGAELVFAEWARMREEERFDILKRIADEDRVGPNARAAMVTGLLDNSMDVREAAYDALKTHGAPVQGFDSSSRDLEIERALPRLRRWAAETES